MRDNTTTKKHIENVIIIGGGPAGLAAAIYTGRAGLSPLVLAGSPPGGQLMLTSQVENYPGFESILGPVLMEKLRAQAARFGARIVDENVVRVDFSKRPFKAFLTGSETRFLSSEKIAFSSPVAAKSIIIATGAKALWLGVPGEERLRGRGVSACATCDGFFFKGKTVAVVGGGDTAMEEALTLTRFAKLVYIIHRRDQFRASKVMQERVFNNPKIKIIWKAVVEEIVGEKKVERIRLRINRKDQKSEVGNQRSQKNSDISDVSDLSGIRLSDSPISSGLSDLKLDGVFIAIGHKPDTEIFKGQVEMDEKGYIITSQKAAIENIKYQKSNINIKNYNFNFQTQTSVPGVFAAGDCVDHIYRQAATAVGMGVAAALELEEWLEINK